MSSDVRVTFLGDSFVAGVGDPEHLGWVGRVAAATRPTTVYNLGVRRDTSADVVRRWSEVTARLVPGTDARLVVSMGVNDTTIEGGAPRVGPAESVAHLRTLLVRSAGLGLSVLVVGPPAVADDEHNQRSRWLSADYAAACNAAGVPFVDVLDALATHPTWTAEVAAGDGAHPGSAGYAVLAGLVLPHWRKWLDPDGTIGA